MNERKYVLELEEIQIGLYDNKRDALVAKDKYQPLAEVKEVFDYA